MLMLVMKAIVFSEQFLISYTVIPVITYSLDKLVCNTLTITLNVFSKAILRIQMRVRDALFGRKRDAKRQGERVLSHAHGRMVVYFWLNLSLSRSAKNCFENKIRIWNHQGCAAAVLCPRRLAFIFGWHEKHNQPRSQHLSSHRPIDERPWERDWNIPSCPAGRPPFWDLTLR